MFRLYGGLLIENEYYNYTELEPLQAGMLAFADRDSNNIHSRLLSLIKSSIKFVYKDADGKDKRELNTKDYLNIFTIDAYKITYEIMKRIKKTDKLIFKENFYCNRCGVFVEKNECWDTLVETGEIDEIFADNYDDLYSTTELVDPIEVENAGSFLTLKRLPVTLGDMLSMPVLKSERDKFNYIWDRQIKEITGMDIKTFNRTVARSHNDSFCAKHIKTHDNYIAMTESMKLFGWDDQYRVLQCDECGNTDFGDNRLDFSNFLQALSVNKKSPFSNM